MREKILSKVVKKPRNEIKQAINRRLKELRMEFSTEVHKFNIHHKWNSNRDMMVIKSTRYNVKGEIFLYDSMVEIYADVPFYLTPLLLPFKGRLVEAIEDELDQLNKKKSK